MITNGVSRVRRLRTSSPRISSLTAPTIPPLWSLHGPTAQDLTISERRSVNVFLVPHIVFTSSCLDRRHLSQVRLAGLPKPSRALSLTPLSDLETNTRPSAETPTLGALITPARPDFQVGTEVSVQSRHSSGPDAPVQSPKKPEGRHAEIPFRCPVTRSRHTDGYTARVALNWSLLSMGPTIQGVCLSSSIRGEFDTASASSRSKAADTESYPTTVLRM